MTNIELRQRLYELNVAVEEWANAEARHEDGTGTASAVEAAGTHALAMLHAHGQQIAEAVEKLTANQRQVAA